jgi:maltose O-acetyltransferase
VQRAADQPVTPRARLTPGEGVGSRPRGLHGWAWHLRRRLGARLRGEQDPARLVRHGLRLGRDVLIVRGCYLDPEFAWLISIGDETTLGPNVTILAHDAVPKLRTGYSLVAPVDIGARVFIGANTTILPGVTIGDDAIVGAGSVIRRDVRAGAIVLGNPAEEVGTTDDHTRRHRDQMQHRPRFPEVDGAGDADRRRILDELGEGPGYVG